MIARFASVLRGQQRIDNSILESSAARSGGEIVPFVVGGQIPAMEQLVARAATPRRVAALQRTVVAAQRCAAPA